MPFERPRILTDSESNMIRGKCLVAKATPEELMLLIGHFDLLVDKYREPLEKLAGCLPNKIYITGAYGDQWSDMEPGPDVEFDEVDFGELLGYDE